MLKLWQSGSNNQQPAYQPLIDDDSHEDEYVDPDNIRRPVQLQYSHSVSDSKLQSRSHYSRSNSISEDSNLSSDGGVPILLHNQDNFSKSEEESDFTDSESEEQNSSSNATNSPSRYKRYFGFILSKKVLFVFFLFLSFENVSISTDKKIVLNY